MKEELDLTKKWLNNAREEGSSKVIEMEKAQEKLKLELKAKEENNCFLVEKLNTTKEKLEDAQLRLGEAEEEKECIEVLLREFMGKDEAPSSAESDVSVEATINVDSLKRELAFEVNHWRTAESLLAKTNDKENNPEIETNAKALKDSGSSRMAALEAENVLLLESEKVLRDELLLARKELAFIKQEMTSKVKRSSASQQYAFDLLRAERASHRDAIREMEDRLYEAKELLRKREETFREQKEELKERISVFEKSPAGEAHLLTKEVEKWKSKVEAVEKRLKEQGRRHEEESEMLLDQISSLKQTWSRRVKRQSWLPIM
jgi:hypothetical protein